MKKLFLVATSLISLSFSAVVCHGQTAIISTFAAVVDSVPEAMAVDASGNIYIADIASNQIRKVTPSGVNSVFAGTGVPGYSGDGGPATAAQLYQPSDLAFDLAGNLYISDESNFAIRKITPAGIITTIAGNGTNAYTGDGGPATAATLGITINIASDPAGNLYLADHYTHTIRKINTSGIITTMAGTFDSAGYSGDGGPATAARFGQLKAMAADAYGNLYVGDNTYINVRKIDAAGIITTIAGTGTAGRTGDGGLAVNAEIGAPYDLKTDAAGNLFLLDESLNIVRMINPSGIISTIAGNGTYGYSGDGGAAEMNGTGGIALDANSNIYVMDQFHTILRKVSYMPDVSSDSMAIYIERLCDGVNLTTRANSTSSLTLYTNFGDGTYVTNTLTPGLPGTESVNVAHVYSVPGKYSIKEVLMRGTTLIDSAVFSYDYLLCRTFAIKFYNDANGDCVKDGSEPFNYLPVITEVDSNGIAIDTISATSGFDYLASGFLGDVYTFKVLSLPAGLYASCPASGTITDTLTAVVANGGNNYFGLSCSSASGFDLAAYVTTRSGRHRFEGDIIVNNPYCNAQPATFTAYTDAKYTFVDAQPAPASVSGNVLTWNFADIDATIPQQHIHFHLEVPGTWLTPGDTVNSDYTVDPVTGDLNPSNNDLGNTDTVKSSFDPNEMTVVPSGYISAGTKLQYTIEFENTGNDTAFNISVYDTLSDNVDAHSLQLVATTAVMNIIPFTAGGHNIVKFDFPGINLLDSTHHNLCTGTVTFNINTKAGLPNGTTVFNHAGIFFDDNPVVMTNTVEDIIGIPTTGTGTLTNRSNVSIYPNPANDELTIRTDNGTYSTATITNLLGQEVISQATPSSQTRVNISQLPTGMYYITLRGQSGVKVLKFEKM